MRHIPVRRAEDFYLPPPAMRPDSWSKIPPAERVWRWYEHKAQRRVTPPPGTLLGERVYARINHSRWVGDCVCGSAQIVTPEDPRFACPECGYGWAPVVFPDDPTSAEEAVRDLPPHERNWQHDEEPPRTRPDPRPPKPHSPREPDLPEPTSKENS